MARIHPAIVLGSVLLIACAKEDPVQDLILPDTCGSNGARMEATVGGNDWCANAHVQGMGSDGTAILTGVSLSGGTMVLEVDTLSTGVRPISEATNSVLYTSMEGSYTVPADGHGTLTLTDYDPTSGRLKGTASVGLRLNGDGVAKQVELSFDVTVGPQ